LFFNNLFTLLCFGLTNADFCVKMVVLIHIRNGLFMKKIASIILTLIILLSSATCLADTSLDDCVSSFTISKILSNVAPINPTVKFSKVIVPETNENPLLAVQYIDGVVTGITTVDISSSTTVKNVTLPYKKTPDEIRFFIWDKGNLKPIGKSVNALTPEVIETANTYVVEELNMCKKTTNHLRGNWIQSSWIASHELLNLIDACAAGALAEKDKHLLTSEYAIRVNDTNLENLKQKAQALPQNQKDKLLEFYNTGKDEYISNITKITTFLGFDLKALL